MKNIIINSLNLRHIIKYILIILITFNVVSSFAQTQTGWIPTSLQTSEDEKQKVYLKDETTSGMLINFDIPGIYVYETLKNDTTYQRISIPGMGTNTGLGNPELPVVGRIIEIPYDIDIELSIFKSDYTTIQNYTVFPYQPPEIDQAKTDSLFIKNYSQYAVNAFFPEKLAEFTAEDIGIIRGHRIVFLKVNPVQYNPVSKELRIYSKIELRVNYSKASQVKGINSRLISEPFEKMLKSAVLNYKDLNRYNKYVNYKDPVQFQLLHRTDEIDDSEALNGCEYLIVTTGDFYDETDANNAVLRFRNWKRQKGLITEVVLFEDIPDFDNTGAVDEEDLIDFIQTAYDTWYPAPTYVLIVGDAGDNAGNVIIPTNYRTPDPSHSNTLRGTDIYYTTVDGDDYFQDIYIGRLSADTDAEATNIINKIIDYEQDPPDAAFPGFYQNAAMLALFEDVNDDGQEERPWIGTVETIRNFLLGQGYGVDRIYTASAGTNDPEEYENGTDLPNDLLVANGFQWNGNANDISTSVNNGRFMVLFRDHGGRQEWSAPHFTNFNVDNLANGVQQPVIFSLACQTGWFDNETDEDNPVTADNAESFCEHFTRNNGDGTVAIIGASRNSKTGYNDFMGLGFMKAIWNDFNPNPPFAAGRPAIPDIIGNPLREMGQILNFGKIYMANAYTNSINREEAFELYHLFGDPNMNMLTEQPDELIVNFPEGIGGNYKQDFLVKVTDQTNNPVNNAIVSLCSPDGQLLKASLSNAGGEVMFSGIFTDNELSLTVVADGFLPVLETIEVSASGGILNRLDSDNVTQGAAFNVGGRYFNGSENVEFYLNGQLMKTEAATNGRVGQLDDQNVSITVPSNLPNGKYNVMLKGLSSNKYALDVLHVRDPNPVDLLLYSQRDPTTYYLHNGDNPTWNNPDIYLTNTNNDVVGSNNLVVGNQYNLKAVIRNKSNFTANNATVTFKWANFGSAQRTWSIIGTDQVSVEPNNNIIAETQWVPPITGHLCIIADIYNNEDTYTLNNTGQENCNVGITSSPLSVKFTVRNPTEDARAIHYEVRQLFPDHNRKNKKLWNTKIVHPDPQVIPSDTETEVTVTVDPDHTYIEAGEIGEFSVTNYLDGEILGGINLSAKRGIERYRISLHGGLIKPMVLSEDYFNTGYCIFADAAYRITPNISIETLFGLNTFGDISASTNQKDKTIYSVNLNAHYRKLIVNPWSIYIRGGYGYYFSANNWKKPGIDSGIGVNYHFNNKLSLDIGINYHRIYNGLDFDLVPVDDQLKDLDFMQAAVGLNYYF